MSAVLDAKPSPSAAWLPWLAVIAGLLLMGVIPDGVLVRVSNISTNETLAFQAHREFLDTLFGAMEKPDAARLVGSLLS